MMTQKQIRQILKIFIITFVVVILFFSTFYTVKAGKRGVLLTFGKASTDAKGEGLHVKVPFVQKVVRMDVQTNKYVAAASAASKDLQVVSTEIAVNYHAMPEAVPKLYTDVGLGYSDCLIQPAVQEIVKKTTAKFTAEALIDQRPLVSQQIITDLTERLGKWNIIVDEVSMTDFDFSDEFNSAIEKKVTAEQKKLQAERDLERIKIEAQQTEAIAIGNKNAAIANAEGQAEAIRVIDETLSKSPQYIEYLKVTRWDGVMPLTLVTGSAEPMILIG